MASTRLALTEIDGAAGVAFTQTSGDASHLPRGRAGLIRGSRVRDFASTYFRNVAPVPAGGFYTIDHSAGIPDGAIMRDGAIFVGDRLMMGRAGFPSPWASPAFHDRDDASIAAELPEQTLSLPGTTANLISLGWQVFGHWLVDVLPRADRLLRSGVPVDRYLFGSPTNDWQVKLIELCGIPLDRCEFVDVNTVVVECETMVVPTFDRLHSELHSDVRHIHSRLLAEVAPGVTATRDLFVARSGWGGSKTLVNRNEIEQAAARAGFEVVMPERLSLREQITLFAAARTVIGETGSAMHMALFSGAGTRVGLIQSWNNFNFVQAQIGRICDQETFYVLGEPSPSAGDDSFVVDPLDVRYLLETVRG